jgi:cytochrome c peroxidase
VPPTTNPPAAQPTKPAPPVPTPPISTPATPIIPTVSQQVTLGRALFFDRTLSNPRGVSCSDCHDPRAGWTNSDSEINQMFGTVPGAVIKRFGNRRPPTVGYAALMQSGPPTLIPEIGIYAGGFFYDGRAATLGDQDPLPLQNPNEMNNTPEGVVQAVASGKNAALYQQTYGVAISTFSADEAFSDVVEAIVAYEESPAVSPFNSRYDQYLAGKVRLSQKELAGLRLFTGSTTGRPGGPPTAKNANCVVCHIIPTADTDGPDLFTAGTFVNTGIPKNLKNPYYQQTNSSADPEGYNPLGAAYIDYGLGDFLYPENSLPSGNTGQGSNGQGDTLKINGMFKTPTLRNVDLRPEPSFVKCYGHNGFFKSLQQVVHFYNTRNLTTVPGEVIDFSSPNPYAGLKGKPLWPAPENPWADTLVNPTGAADGLMGNLGLSPQDEANLVAFLKTLSDRPVPPR